MISGRHLAMTLRLHLLVPLLLMSTCMVSNAYADDDEIVVKVKAAVLYNFAKFVTWPAYKFSSPNAPLEICVVEPDPLGATLDETVRGKVIQGHPLVVIRRTRAVELRSCHIVYTAEQNVDQLSDILDDLADSSVLVVHEYSTPMHNGTVRFLIDNRRLQFEVNMQAVKHQQLQLSSKLLSLSKVVWE